MMGLERGPERRRQALVTGSNRQDGDPVGRGRGKKLQTFQGHTGEVTSVALSGDGKHLWTASPDGTTRLWDPATGKERCRLYSLDAGKDWLVATPRDSSTVPRRLEVRHLSRPGHPETGR